MRLKGKIKYINNWTGNGAIVDGAYSYYFLIGDIVNYDPSRIEKGLSVEFSVGKGTSHHKQAIDITIHYAPHQIIDYYSRNWEEIEATIDDRELSDFPVISTDIVDNSFPLKVSELPLIALALFEREIKVVSLNKDGRYRFLDEAEGRHNIIYPSFIEEISLHLAIEEFEDLINSPKAKENDFQNFFERHQDFILNDDYKQAHPHIVLSKENEDKLIPDFILEPVDQSSFCDLLELKLPTADIFVLKKNRERYSAAVFEAAAQLREYGKYFDEERNRSKFQQTYPHLRVYKPRMFVIIGRQNDGSLMKKREIQAEFPHLFLKTYDELLARMKWKKDKLQNKNKLF